ncbi:MAG TPA: hypothetical protein PKC28_10385, partial [Bdellovibrionales bacterium]|nr:hypothetical protein [Bdellovibrionales bacterium]
TSDFLMRMPIGDEEDRSGAGMKVEPGEIDNALRKSTVIHAVQLNDPRSKLHLLSFLVDNFRGLVYNSLVLGTQSSPRLSAAHETRVTVMTSFLTAAISNLKSYPQLPIANVVIKPDELGVKTYDGIFDLQTAVSKHGSNQHMQKLSIPTYQNSEETVDLGSFLGTDPPNSRERRRMDVMIETSRRIQKILEPVLTTTLQTRSFSDLSEPVAWVNSLSDKSPKEAYRDAAQAILEEYFRFSAGLYDLSLAEMRNRQGIASMQTYDEVRLFLMCVDSAVTQMPWGYLTEFILKALNLATTDLAVGQKTSLQHFLFKSQFSPLATVTPESIIANARSISVMKDVNPETEQKWQNGFDQNCVNFLAGDEQ